jgi:hypothetical protein
MTSVRLCSRSQSFVTTQERRCFALSRLAERYSKKAGVPLVPDPRRVQQRIPRVLTRVSPFEMAYFCQQLASYLPQPFVVIELCILSNRILKYSEPK